MTRRNQAGITAVEILVLLVVVGVLAALTIPSVSGGPGRNEFTQVLNNALQLQFATYNVSLEAEAAGETHLAWPGEQAGSFSNWIASLTNILSTNDICKMLSGPGIRVRPEDMFSMEKTALRVYAVTRNSASNTVMISSANFTNTPTGGIPLQSSIKPYGKKGFIVMEKGGNGRVLMGRYVGNPEVIGGYAPLCQ